MQSLPEEPLVAFHTTPTLSEKFYTLREKVLERKPVLRHIVEKHGDKVLYDYAKEYAQVNLNPPIKRRQDELIGTIQRIVTERLGDDVGVSVGEQLKKYYFVSTTDHHGAICHPFFLNGNLISSATYFDASDPVLSNIIVLACANISLNNSSYPRGLLFHSNLGNQQEMHRLSFFPASDRLCPVYGYRSYTHYDIERMKQDIERKARTQAIAPTVAQKLMYLIDTVYASDQALSAATFSDQITLTNTRLWNQFFAPNHIDAPRLIYIEQETVVSELLINYHLNHDTIIKHILFNPKLESLIHKYFQGIRGAFSLFEQSGTYFFWALPKGQKYRQQLWKRGEYLVTADESYRIALAPDAIAEALRTKEIIPSMLLTFMVLAFYYGLKCLGGFSQVNYLTLMKRAYIKMLADLENYKSIEVCARVQTKELCGEVTLAFLKNSEGTLMPATGLDLLLYGNDMTWTQFVELSKNVTLAEALNPLMSEFYKILFPENTRQADLAALTPEEITHLTGLHEKIKPCAIL